MNHWPLLKLSLLPLLTAAAIPLHAQDFPHGRIRHTEPQVVVQRASEERAEVALANFPFLPGDRIWTDDTGRVEFQFDDGSLVRLDRASKLEYRAEGESSRGSSVLRLWSGALFVHSRDSNALGLAIETPAATIDIREPGVYRIDAGDGTSLSVLEGEAFLDAGRGVRVRAGERAGVYAGRTPRVETIDRSQLDAFARWDEGRGDPGWAGRPPESVPEEVAAYTGELDTYGSWYDEPEIGVVWHPSVESGWRPYTNGEWIWTSYGWTWVPNEPWGWAPFHYGRWGHSAIHGWYWIPGNRWGPAWVSWAVGPDHVGWCALGRGDRPVRILSRLDRSSFRGSVRRETHDDDPWIYTRRQNWTRSARVTARLGPDAVRQVRPLDSPNLRLSRDLRVERGAPVSRTIRTRPTPGDTVPELRGDPLTTIPRPLYAAARARSRERERREQDQARSDPDRDVLRPLFRPLSGSDRPRDDAAVRSRGGNERTGAAGSSDGGRRPPREHDPGPRVHERPPSHERAGPPPDSSARRPHQRPRPESEGSAHGSAHERRRRDDR